MHSAHRGDGPISETIIHLLIKFITANKYYCLIGGPQTLLGKSCASNSYKPYINHIMREKLKINTFLYKSF
jgi:hypothetical protein